MITMPTNSFMISMESDEIFYKSDGVIDLAREAYEKILWGCDAAPIIDDVVAVYQDMIDNEFVICSETLGYTEDERWHARNDLIADSLNFVVEYCARNNLAARKRIYSDPEFIVKDISRVVTPQVQLFYFVEDQFVCLNERDETRVIDLETDTGQINTEAFARVLQEVNELCIC